MPDQTIPLPKVEATSAPKAAPEPTAYVAVTNVGLWAPGETIKAHQLTAESRQRLLEMGAIVLA